MDGQPAVKPGYKTTELGGAASVLIMAVLLNSGLIKPGDGETVSGAITNAVAAITSLAGAITLIWKYIQSRHEQKLAAMQPTVKVLTR